MDKPLLFDDKFNIRAQFKHNIDIIFDFDERFFTFKNKINRRYIFYWLFWKDYNLLPFFLFICITCPVFDTHLSLLVFWKKGEWKSGGSLLYVFSIKLAFTFGHHKITHFKTHFQEIILILLFIFWNLVKMCIKMCISLEVCDNTTSLKTSNISNQKNISIFWWFIPWYCSDFRGKWKMENVDLTQQSSL